MLFRSYEIKGNQFKRFSSSFDTEFTIDYTTGYSVLPDIYKVALLNQVYYLYDNRSEAASDMSPIAKTILNPLKRV